MYANDLKQGDKVQRTYGDIVTIEDNKKGVIRMISCPVWGMPEMTDVGSSYIHDFAFYLRPDGTKEPIEFTPTQKAQCDNIEAMGF